MSPTRSTARLGIQRKKFFPPSGSHVLPWAAFAATVPPVTFSWYHRTAAFPPVVALQFVFVALSPRCTVCEPQTDSAPPMFEYCACAIARISSESRPLPGVGMSPTLAFGQHVGASCSSGPAKVDVEILSQSAWSL